MITGGSLHAVAGDLEVPAGDLIGLVGDLSSLSRDMTPCIHSIWTASLEHHLDRRHVYGGQRSDLNT